MDPFSIVVGVAGLVTLVTQTLNLTTNYISGVKHSSRAASDLAKELEVLRSILMRLDAFLGEESSKKHLSSFTDDSVLFQSTHACHTQLLSLHNKLERGKDQRIRTALTWPMAEKEHRQSIQQLRTLTHWIQFALTIDGCTLLSKSSVEIRKILGEQLECFQTLQEINTRTASVERSIKGKSISLALTKPREIVHYTEACLCDFPRSKSVVFDDDLRLLIVRDFIGERNCT